MCQQIHLLRYKQTPKRHPMPRTKCTRMSLKPRIRICSKLRCVPTGLTVIPANMEISVTMLMGHQNLPCRVISHFVFKRRERTAKGSLRTSTAELVTTVSTSMNTEWSNRSSDITTTQTWLFTSDYSLAQKTKADSSTILRLGPPNYLYLGRFMLRVTCRHMKSSSPAVNHYLSLLIVLTATVDRLARVTWWFHKTFF